MVLGLLIGAAVLGGGFVATRNFVRRRLRFVDAVRSPAAPLVAGIAGGLAASVVALPLGVLLPVGVWTAAAFGVGVAGGGAGGRGAPARPPRALTTLPAPPGSPASRPPPPPRPAPTAAFSARLPGPPSPSSWAAALAKARRAG